jgi:hypothetical protein
VLENKDQLVLTAVECSHPAVALDPDAKILEFAVYLPAGGKELADVPPIHTHKMKGAIFRVTGDG